MANNTDTEAIKATVDEHGIVWYIDGDGLPTSSGCDIDDFLVSEIVAVAETMRIVGSSQNAELIHKIYHAKVNTYLPALKSIQVCSPNCCESAEDKKDPEIVLYRSRIFNYPPCLGGWHEVDIKDYPGYLLAAHFRQQQEATEFTRNVLIHHAAWDSLSFVGNLDHDMVCRLLGLLIDPRWFIDLYGDSSRGSRMEQFLNLTPHSQEAATQDKVTWSESRCRLVMDCWKSRTEDKIVIDSPDNFLWRAWKEKGGGYKGDLVAAKLLISFLRLTWLQAIYTGPKPERLFVPEYFFSNKDEVEAYKAHTNRLRQGGQVP